MGTFCIIYVERSGRRYASPVFQPESIATLSKLNEMLHEKSFRSTVSFLNVCKEVAIELNATELLKAGVSITEILKDEEIPAVSSLAFVFQATDQSCADFTKEKLKRIHDLMSEVYSIAGLLGELADVLDPNVDCYEGIRILTGVYVDSEGVLRSCNHEYLAKKKQTDELPDGSKLEYWVHQRSGYCEDDFYGVILFEVGPGTYIQLGFET